MMVKQLWVVWYLEWYGAVGFDIGLGLTELKATVGPQQRCVLLTFQVCTDFVFFKIPNVPQWDALIDSLLMPEILVANINLDSVLIRERKNIFPFWLLWQVNTCSIPWELFDSPVHVGYLSPSSSNRGGFLQTHLPPRRSTSPSSTSCVCSHPWVRTGMCSDPTSVLCQTTAVIGHIKHHIRSCMMTNDSERQ